MGKRKKAERKRAKARAKVQLNVRETQIAERLERRFTAAVGTPYRAPPVGADQSGDLAVSVAYDRLLAWGRHLDQNSGPGVAVLDELVNRTVGAGIRVVPEPVDNTGNPLPQLVAPLTELWETWSERADVTDELSEPALERLEARAWFRDGECFGQHVAGRNRNYPFEPGETPYRYELLESDWCAIDFDDPKRGYRLGVQLDAWRRPRAYAIHRHQPNDYWVSGSTAADTRADIKRLRRENVSHIKFTRRWPQTRGVSIFAAALTAMYDLSHYMESERVAARVAASLTGFIRRDPTQFQAPTAEQAERQRELELQAGQIFDDLLPGEEIGAISLDRPNTALVEFRREIIRDICSAAGARYSPVARDFVSGTYSGQRQELVEALPLYDHLSTSYVRHGPRARRRRLILTAVLDGTLQVPAGASLRSISRARYYGPPMPWIDPEKEARALLARAEAAQALGVEPEQLRDITPNPTQLEALPS